MAEVDAGFLVFLDEEVLFLALALYPPYTIELPLLPPCDIGQPPPPAWGAGADGAGGEGAAAIGVAAAGAAAAAAAGSCRIIPEVKG